MQKKQLQTQVCNCFVEYGVFFVKDLLLLCGNYLFFIVIFSDELIALNSGE